MVFVGPGKNWVALLNSRGENTVFSWGQAKLAQRVHSVHDSWAGFSAVEVEAVADPNRIV